MNSSTSALDHSPVDDLETGVLAPIFRRSMLWTPEREASSAWVEHVPFAFWLVDVLRPRRIVELGTCTGVSYSAFCQAVKTLDIATSCSAIDTWKGDEHSGFYEDDVYHEFRAFHDRRYGAFSQLVRSRFDDAIERFEAGSIDLLHIDGPHTYEAARHDYETWLPKLAADAILLLHNTNFREGDCGVFRLWREISADKPHFEFVHGHGLGVLGLSHASPDPLALFFHATNDDSLRCEIRRTFTALGRAAPPLSEQRRFGGAASEYTGKVGSFEQAPSKRDRTIGESQDTLGRRDSEIRTLQRMLSKRDTEIAELKDALSSSIDEIRTLKDIHRAKVERAVAQLKSSWPWRITAPLRAVRQRLSAPVDSAVTHDYESWVLENDSLDDDDRHTIGTHIASFADRPKLSVLMPVYNTPVQHLRQAINSVTSQLYEDWELCIVDDSSTSTEVREILHLCQSADPRIRVRFRDGNGGISACANTALEMASGDWIILMNHDDNLAEHALYMIAEVVNRVRDAAIIYSDEDKIDAQGRRFDPYFKPDWDYDLFLGQNLINHLGAYRADLARAAGGFREGLEGSHEWDFALRVLESNGGTGVHHVPFVLYHCRHNLQSFSHAWSSGPIGTALSAVTGHLKRTSQAAEVSAAGRSRFLRIRRFLPEARPLVSVVIPTRNQCEVLRTCVDGLVNRTGYAPLEVVIVDNGSTEPDARDFLADLRSRPGFVVLRDDGAFNFSRLVNRGVAASSGDICVLLNNDVDVINAAWLDELVVQALRPDVGAVGAKLYYPDDTLQHGGVVLGIGGIAAHVHNREPRRSHGYFGDLSVVHTVSCVTGACLATRRTVYDEVGGFDEVNLAIAYNDVDFCIRVRESGYKIIWTPNAELYHYESVSRGVDTAPKNVRRFKAETRYMRGRWGKVLDNDPCYNPNLSLQSEFFEIAAKSRAHKPWLTHAPHDT